MLDMSLPIPENDNGDSVNVSKSNSAETHPRGSEPYNWKTIEKTIGLVPAQIIADRLKYEGIPARAVQEGAGRALGLTVGLLGEGRVLVPDIYEEEARQTLARVAKEVAEWAHSDEFANSDEFVDSDYAE